MTDNTREVQLKATMDATGVRAGVDQAKTALGDLSRSAEREGTKAGAGIAKAGEGAEKSAAASERAIGRFEAQLRRLNAEAQAAAEGTGKAGAILNRALAQGLDVSRLEPGLAKLRELERAATAGLGTMGVSAAQTAAALRQVPAQFTDIATSLAAGQAPLTVLLQQGGQLKDSFGGAGAAAKALGGYVLGLINPFTVAAAAVGGLGYAYLKGSGEAEAFQKTLILTGNIAGTTAQQLSTIAASISGGGITQGAAAEALNQLAATGKVGAENLGRFAAAAVQLERVGGPAVKDTVTAFAELGKSPLQAALKLNESTNFLTASLYDQIKALEQQGKATEAAKVAQEAFAAAAEQRIPALTANLGLFEKAWLGVSGAIRHVGDELANIGRADTLSGLESSLASARSRAARANGGGLLDNLVRDNALSSAAAYQKQIDALKEIEKRAKDAAEADAQRLKSVQARAEFDKLAEQSLDKQAKLKIEIQRIENLGLAAGKSRADIEAQIAAARERARDKSSDTAAQRALEKEAELLERAIGLSGTYYKTLQGLDMLRKKGALTEEQYVKAVQDLIQAQPIVSAQLKAENEARRDAQKVLDDQAKAYQRTLDAQLKSVDRVGEQIQKLKDENEAISISAERNVSLAAAIELVHTARLKEAMAKADAAGDYLAASALQAEIDKRKELAKLINSKDAREAAKKSADDAAKEWERATRDIERSITDSLMRGFESGKSFAVTLRDTVVNMFKTMVLRPVISAVVNPVANVLGGALSGIGNSVAAGLGLGGLFGAGTAAAATGAAAAGGSLFSLGLQGSLAGFSELGILGGASQALTSASSLLSAGSLTGAIGAALPVLAPVALGAYLLNKAFGGSSTHHGGAGVVSDGSMSRAITDGGLGLDWSYGDSVGRYYNQGVNDALKSITGNEAALLNAVNKAFGGTGTYSVGGYFASDGRRESQGSRSVLLDGTVLSSVSGKGLDADPTKGLQQFSDQLASQVRSAMDSIGLPDWARKMLSDIGAAPTMEQLAGAVNQVITLQTALKSLGDTLPPLAGVTLDAASALMAAFGGIEGLTASVQSYYQSFYSDAERAANTTSQLTKALGDLGLSLPATREAYRNLVEAQDLSTEAGRAAYAQLLKLAPTFADLVPATQALATAGNQAADAVAEAAAKMADAGRKVLAELADQQGDLQVSLLRAQGQAAAAAELERARAIARLAEGLSAQDADAATAAYDFNRALQAQIDTLNAAAQAAQNAAAAEAQRVQAEQQRAQAVAAEALGIQSSIDQLLGNTAAIRERELAALDPANRELQNRLYQLLDEKAAQQAAAQAQEAATRAAEESARAAEESARAAEQVRQAWQGVTDSLLDEAARLRKLGGADAGAGGFAAAQRDYVIGLAQANAGSQDAARSLPALSQALTSVAERQAADFGELQRLRLRIAAQLEAIGTKFAGQYGLTLPKLATGTNLVPRDMAAILHAGEAVVPAPFNPVNGGGGIGGAEVVEAINGLREEQKAQALALVTVQKDVARVLKAWNADGLPRERVETT